jgi:hypothetical protein
MWRDPWSFVEAFVIASTILAVGILLHFTLGPIPFHGFTYPLNIIGGVGILLLSLLLAILARRGNRIATFLTGYKMSIAAMAILMGLSIIMGLTRQIELAAPHGANLQEPIHAVGFSYMLLYVVFPPELSPSPCRAGRYHLYLYPKGAATQHALE